MKARRRKSKVAASGADAAIAETKVAAAGMSAYIVEAPSAAMGATASLSVDAWIHSPEWVGKAPLPPASDVRELRDDAAKGTLLSTDRNALIAQCADVVLERWNEARREKCITTEWFAGKRSPSAIAKACGCSQKHVRVTLDKHGMKRERT